MAFLVEIGLNNPSSGASTYDVYITDFDTNTGWIQVVTGITYNQFPVIVNTDDYPDVNEGSAIASLLNHKISPFTILPTLSSKCNIPYNCIL